MDLSAILAALTNQSSQPGYDQGAVMGTNPQTALGQALAAAQQQPQAQPGQMAPMGYGGHGGQGPISQAMAQQPQAPQQAPQDPNQMAPYGYAPQDPTQAPPGATPQAPQQPAPMAPEGSAMGQQGQSPIQGMFQRQATDPNMALYQGLMQGGAAMLGGKNMQQGMAGAVDGFQNGFNKTLDQQRELNTPKITPLADGAFTSVQMPGQQPQIMPNGQVQDYLMGKVKAQAQLGMQKTILTNNLQAQRQQDVNDRAQAATYGPKLQVTNQALATTQAALAAAKDQAAGGGYMPQVAGTAPGLANFLGMKDAPKNNLIQNALVDTQLAQDAQKSGAITDQQARTLGADVPGIGSDRATVLIPFLERRIEALNRYQAFQQQQVDKGNPAVPTGFAGGGGAPSPQGTGVQPAAAVTDAASYAAVPSGALYTTPAGITKRKQ